MSAIPFLAIENTESRFTSRGRGRVRVRIQAPPPTGQISLNTTHVASCQVSNLTIFYGILQCLEHARKLYLGLEMRTGPFNSVVCKSTKGAMLNPGRFQTALTWGVGSVASVTDEDIFSYGGWG